MPKVGGARPGAGRPKGSLNRKHTEPLAASAEAGATPVEYMLSVMRNEQADAKERAWAAEKAAPYIHPRPAPVANRVELDLPDTSTAEGLSNAMTSIVKAISEGRLAPSEAQSITSVLEAQRKVIETGEILERLTELEAIIAGRSS